MKRIILICLSLIMLAACIPTPEEEYVISKQDVDADAVLLNTAEPVAETMSAEPDGDTESTPHVTLAERIGAPEHCTEETFSKRVPFDTLTVQIDADVHVPDTEKVGVYTATFDVPFSETQQKALILRYLGEERPFNVKIEEGKYWRKWQVQEIIEYHQKELQRDDALEDNEMREIMLEQDNESLQSAMEQYRNAPEDWEHVDWNGEVAKGRGENAKPVVLYANTDQPAHYKRVVFTAYSFEYGDETQQVCEIITSAVDYRDAHAIEPQTDAERTSAKLAEEEMNRLGVGTFCTKSVQPSVDSDWQTEGDPVTGHSVQLWYTVDGLPFYDFQAWHGDDNLMNHLEETGEKKNEDYNVYLPGQYRARVGVRDGKVASISINGMHNVTGCINENVQLLPFETVMETFKEQIAYHYYTGDWEHPDSGKGETLVITDIRLSMMRVRKKDSPEEFYLLPVWDFQGYMLYPNWPMEGEDLERQKQWAESLSFLTINAVDGTIIDRNLGY